MSKPFFYRDKTAKVEKEKPVIIRIEFPDPGTEGPTFVNVPGINDIPIINEENREIGTYETLKAGPTIITARPKNFADHIDSVKYNIYINNVLIVEHKNAKEVDPTPTIIVLLNFESI